jgi:hypothetical protein
MIFASFLLSLELINFNDSKVIFFALILIANVLHITSFYSLIPIGVFGDQRVQNVDLIVRSGRTAGVNPPKIHTMAFFQHFGSFLPFLI